MLPMFDSIYWQNYLWMESICHGPPSLSSATVNASGLPLRHQSDNCRAASTGPPGFSLMVLLFLSSHLFRSECYVGTSADLNPDVLDVLFTCRVCVLRERWFDDQPASRHLISVREQPSSFGLRTISAST